MGGSPTQTVTKYHNAVKDKDISKALSQVTDECRNRLGPNAKSQQDYLKEIINKTEFKSFTIKSESYDEIGATVEAELITEKGKVNEVFFLNKVGGIWLLQDGKTPLLPMTDNTYQENIISIVEIAFNYISDMAVKIDRQEKDYENLKKVIDEGITRINRLNPPVKYKEGQENVIELMKVVEKNVEIGRKLFYEVKDPAEKDKLKKEQNKSIKKEVELKAEVLKVMPFLSETNI